MQDNTGSFPTYPIIRSRIIPGTDPAMIKVTSTSAVTTNDDDYIYSKLYYENTFGPERDTKYIKWHKTTLAYEFITAGEMPAPTLGFQLAYAGEGNPQKPWQQTATEMQQSDANTTWYPPAWYTVLTLSLFQEERFPYQDFQYKEWVP